MSALDGDALVDELEQVIHAYLLAEMPLDPSGELAAMDLASLLIAYSVWIGRPIPRAPRVVHQSREMHASPKTVEHAADLEVLMDKIRNGDDLRSHLSERVATAYVPETKAANQGNQQRADRDVLLAVWGRTTCTCPRRSTRAASGSSAARTCSSERSARPTHICSASTHTAPGAQGADGDRRPELA